MGDDVALLLLAEEAGRSRPPFARSAGGRGVLFPPSSFLFARKSFPLGEKEEGAFFFAQRHTSFLRKLLPFLRSEELPPGLPERVGRFPYACVCDRVKGLPFPPLPPSLHYTCAAFSDTDTRSRDSRRPTTSNRFSLSLERRLLFFRRHQLPAFSRCGRAAHEAPPERRLLMVLFFSKEVLREGSRGSFGTAHPPHRNEVVLFFLRANRFSLPF